MDRSRASGRKKNISFRNKRRKTVYEHVTKGDIRRLARRGGVRRISALIYDVMRSVLKTYLDNLIKDSVTYCGYFNRKTVQVSDVIRALKNRGERLYGFDDPPFPIRLRTAIVLNDTPEDSVPSTVELSETPETRSNARDLKNSKENIPTTSKGFLEDLGDSDATLSDIALPVRKNRASLILEDDQITNASSNNDSDVSDSLISPEVDKEFAAKVNRENFNNSKSTSNKTKKSFLSYKHLFLDTTTNGVGVAANADNSELAEEKEILPLLQRNKFFLNTSKNSKVSTKHASKGEDTTNLDDLESTEENDSFMSKNKNRKFLSTLKTSVSKRASKDDVKKISVQDTVKGASNSDATKQRKKLSANGRRKLFRNSRNTVSGLEYSGEIGVSYNSHNPSTSRANPTDSDDFQDNSDILSKNNKKILRKSKSVAGNEKSVQRSSLNRSNSDVKENREQSEVGFETDSNEEDIFVVWESKYNNNTSGK